jgi:hypothetical protein
MLVLHELVFVVIPRVGPNSPHAFIVRYYLGISDVPGEGCRCVKGGRLMYAKVYSLRRT